jgi:hypothetical protein
MLIQSDGNGNASPQLDKANLLATKYGISKQQFPVDTTACSDTNGQNQLTDPFTTSIPLSSTIKCLFNLIVCDKSANDNVAIVQSCKMQGTMFESLG